MKHITVIGIDLAKKSFQVYAQDAQGNPVFNKAMSRKKLLEYMSQLPVCLVGMEACGTAHYFARTFESMGHEVKLVDPRRVKAYVVRNKTDANDAEAIAEATMSKKVKGIAIKSVAQQEISHLHKARSHVIKRRVSVAHHLRSQLAEYGVITRTGGAALRKLVAEVLAGEHVSLAPHALFALQDMYEEYTTLTKRIAAYDAHVQSLCAESEAMQTLMTLPGIGKLTASALLAKVNDFSAFTKAASFAAYLGLTPKESSSGQKRILGAMSKQGDRYLRTLLIHGARTVIQCTIKKQYRQTRYHRWILSLVERVGKNKAAVALANKHARMLWAIMNHTRNLDLDYDTQAA